VLVAEVVRRSAGVYIDAVRLGTRLAWWGANFTLEQMQRVVGGSGEPRPGMDDATLKAKVQTELFRPVAAPKGGVTIGVVDGVVELRGTAQTQRQIRDFERRAREIPEVRDVENRLHQPSTPARTGSDAPAPAPKRSAGSRRGQRGRVGGHGSSPSAGKRPAQDRPAVGNQRERPTSATPERPAPGGQRPAPGGRRPTPGTGGRPAPSAGARRAPGTEARPTPSAGVPLRSGGPGIARSHPTHPRTNDVLGVLARRADSGDHVNQAQICKALGLDASEVADVLRTLSTTNLVSRASTGNWQLTPAGEREVEPGPRPKEPRPQPREPQAS
jgi:BON domain